MLPNPTETKIKALNVIIFLLTQLEKARQVISFIITQNMSYDLSLKVQPTLTWTKNLPIVINIYKIFSYLKEALFA